MATKIGPRELALREMREQEAKAPTRPRVCKVCMALHGTCSHTKPRPDEPATERRAAPPPPATEAATENDMAKKAKRGPSRPKAKRAKAAKPKKAAARKAKPAARKARTPKEATARRPREGTVPAQAVADLISRPGGASMEELVAHFKIEAHPMRAKIHYVRHKLGYDVETKDGRYHGTPPKAQAQAAE